MAKNKNKIICRHGKRSALRSPLAFDSSELFIDASGALMLNIIIKNVSSAESPVYVESAGLVIRCFDKSGNLIVSGGREIVSKTLKFPDSGIAPDAAVGIKTKIDLSPDMVADFDVYIGCIRTTSLVVTDFVRSDFFDEPEEPILLTAGMTDEEIYDVCDKISEDALYYPEELTSLVWRCTCGEITDASSCPKCSAERSELFGFFTNLVKPARKSSEKGDGRKRTHLLIALFSVTTFILALVLALLLVFFLSDGRYGGRPSGPDLGNPTDSEQKEETIEEKTERLEALIAAKDFTAALALAQSESTFASRVSPISEQAVEHYLDADNYDKAREFAKTASDPLASTQSVLNAGYAYYINNAIFDKALEYAQMLQNPQKINAVYIFEIDHLVNQEKFSEAIEVAISANLDAKKEEVITAAVAHLSSARKYSQALEFARLSNAENATKDLAREAAYYYVEQNDVEKALEFSEFVNEDTLLRAIASKLSDAQLRERLGEFFEYLSFERKQSIYANSVSLDKQIAVINTAGKVFYGAGKTYTPPSGLRAVSVKTSAHHTVILLSDGSVVAFGDNSFEQCDVSLWKKVIAIEVGQYHTVALFEDGTVRAIGNRDFNQCSLSDLSDVIMIAAGDYHTLALLSDGTVRAVGMNGSSQCNTSSWEKITMISAGALHSVGLTSDGTVVATGSHSLGRCDVSSWKNVVMISAGSSHTLALLDDGTVVACGGVVGGSYGSLVFGEKVSYIDAGSASIAVITESGKLVLTGDGLPTVSHVIDQKVNPDCFFTNDD